MNNGAATKELTADEANALLDAAMTDSDRAYWAEAERTELEGAS